MKKGVKKILSIILAVSLIFPAFSCFQVEAAMPLLSVKMGSLTFKKDLSRHTAILKKCDRLASGKIEIPNKINGYRITEIDSRAFEGCNLVTMVIIRNNVEKIGYAAFRGCSNLSNVVFIDSDRGIQIDDGAFSGCINLEKILGFEHITQIGSNVFSGCISLSEVNLTSCKKIGEAAFYNCIGLANVTVPSTVEQINYSAFDGVRNISYSGELSGAPWGARCLNGFLDANNNIYYDSSLKNLCSWAPNAAGNIIIPDTVETIGAYAFCGQKHIITVTLPSSIKRIEHGAFFNCSSIININVSDSVEYVANNAFYNVRNIQRDARYGSSGARFMNGFCENGYVYLSSSKTEIIFASTAISGEINIPENVKVIGANAFSECCNLVKINLPETVETIGSAAFKNCISLKTIIIPETVKKISSHTFNGCVSLLNISLPPKLTEIPDYLFYCCSSLKEVIIPETVEIIENRAFYNCKSLSSIVIPENIKEIGEEAFYNCTSLIDILFNNKNNFSIGENAFGNIGQTRGFASIQNLLKVTFNENVIYIPDNLFNSNNTYIYYVYIGKNVRYIGDNAFYNCIYVNYIDIPDGVETIGANAFYNVKNISYNSDRMTAEGSPWGAKSSTAFVENDLVYYDSSKKVLIGCESEAEAIVVPDMVEVVDDYVFCTCANLTEVVFESQTISFSPDSLAGNDTIQTISSANTYDGITFTQNICESGLQKAPRGDNGVRYTADSNGILFCNKNKSGKYSVPSEIKYICDNAFANCENLTVEIPDDVMLTRIGSNAFFNSGNYGNWEQKDDFYIGNYFIYPNPYAEDCTLNPGTICIADEAFLNNKTIKRFYAAATRLMSIGRRAFRFCESLEEITLPSNIQHIGTEAFAETQFISKESEQPVYIDNSLISVPNTLSSVTIKNGTTCIADGAFENCNRITQLSVPEGITTIGAETFSCCKSLREISLPESLVSIDKYAFANCDSLESIDIPKNVREIGEYAFFGCSSIAGFDVSEENESYSSENGILFNNEKTTLIQFPAGKDVSVGKYVIPENVDRIESLAFRRCWNIDTVYIPGNAAFGAKNPFENCRALYGKYSGNFSEANIDYTLYQGSSIVSVSNRFGGIYNVEQFVTSIGDNAFKDNESLTGVIFPEGFREIGNDSFNGCTGISEIHFPVSLEIIGDSAFENCTGLKNVEFGVNDDSGVNTLLVMIGKKAFCNCDIQNCNDDILICPGLEIGEYAFHTHKYGDWTIIQKADCLNTGLKSHACKCGNVENAVISALGHRFTHYIFNNNATIEKDGTETAVCDRCSVTDTRTAAGTRKAPAEIEIVNFEKYNNKSVDFKSTITFRVDVKYGYGTEWFVNGKKAEVNSDGSCTVRTVTDTVEIYCTTNDYDGNTVKSETEIINVKHGFFDKLIAFFRGLFKSLPEIIQ